ncbi:sulfite oxidase [Paenibacillus filicis]|uniref:Sulfite oxidase n=1 Tax=Paenibacillus gyeongsangnamensis TaxID=3388067 RepID=A0ABT4QER3_9BACL|nr:sulfite oxidase [Paenibacillus filicis]MCZ8515373.1 sulfite oxidase [Paenibacillus filicis]
MRLYHPQRIPRSVIPENQEFPMLSLSSQITPEALHYVRNHFPYPYLPAHDWHLNVEGCVRNPLQLSYNDLINMPQVTLPVTLECSGNKRAFYEPKVRGEQWELGAVSHALWTGVRLREILQSTGILSEAQEIIFEGMDSGQRTDMPGTFIYSRSLPIYKAIHPDTLIALFMNGKPLPYKHGYPARLIVPGWYGMASVKWLQRIIVSDRPFQGPYQKIDYIVYPSDPNQSPRPVTVMKVNSVIAQPTDRAVLKKGTHHVFGAAWSGEVPVSKIQINLDDEETWYPATWIDPEERYSWRRWIWEWHASKAGTYLLKSKATDSNGNTQPLHGEWNAKGYENNSIHQIVVYVE